MTYAGLCLCAHGALRTRYMDLVAVRDVAVDVSCRYRGSRSLYWYLISRGARAGIAAFDLRATGMAACRSIVPV